VSCCDDSGSGVRVFDGACYHAKTYNEAEAICLESGHRLCSLAEMLNQATRGAGCNHDARYNWVWDECDIALDTSASGNIYGPDEATTSDQVRNFEDFIPMVMGAAGGIMVIAVIVAIVVMMRKKKVTEEKVNEMADINSAPDASSVPVDGTETSST